MSADELATEPSAEPSAERECAICLSSLTEPVRAPCGHSFCRACCVRTLSSTEEPGSQPVVGCCPVCRSHIALSSVRTIVGDQPLQQAPAVPLQLAGAVFVQGQMPGLASYHFDSSGEGAHISYASPLCAHWPALDDGSRPPAEKPFTDVSFGPGGTWFEGTIDWSPTSWKGDTRWRYRMEFSPDFATVMRGSIEVTTTGGARRVDSFGSDLRYVNVELLGGAQAYPSLAGGPYPPPATPVPFAEDETDGEGGQQVSVVRRWLRDFFF